MTKRESGEPKHPNPLSQAQRNALDRLFDRVEDRLMDAPEGMHRWNEGASEAELQAAGLDPERGYMWTRFNGLDLGQGEVKVFALADLNQHTQEAMQQGLLQSGDRVVGRRGEDLFVFPADPFEEGADVLLVDARKSRGPLGSSPGHWLLALLGEFSIVYGYDGEYRDDLYDVESGELREQSRRRILRRKLDSDPDSALTRFELAQCLIRNQEYAGAATELRRAIRCAPEFAWSHYELGRALFYGQKPAAADRSFAKAQRLFAPGSSMQALSLAFGARCQEPAQRNARLAELHKINPGFATEQVELAQEWLEDEDFEAAQEALELAQVAAPKNLSALALIRELREHLQRLSEE